VHAVAVLRRAVLFHRASRKESLASARTTPRYGRWSRPHGRTHAAHAEPGPEAQAGAVSPKGRDSQPAGCAKPWTRRPDRSCRRCRSGPRAGSTKLRGRLYEAASRASPNPPYRRPPTQTPWDSPQISRTNIHALEGAGAGLRHHFSKSQTRYDCNSCQATTRNLRNRRLPAESAPKHRGPWIAMEKPSSGRCSHGQLGPVGSPNAESVYAHRSAKR